MADPRITPALREFGFGAKRLLKPLTLGTTPPLMLRMSGDDQPVAAPASQGYYLPPDARDYRPARSAQPVAPSDDYYAPYYQLPRGDDPNAISFSGNDYSREMDARVAQARAAQAAQEFGQQKMQMEQQEMDRARQAWAAEDEANAAIAEGVPVDQVIRQFPQLAQSKSFGNYARQVARPAQNTLAPHFRQMLKSQEARADFDEHFSRFADVQKADDYAREQEANRLLRIDAIESGVPLEAFEKMKGPLTRENVALLKRQYADKANIDPAERDYREAIKLLADADKAERAASGATFDPEAFQKRQTALRNLYFPPAPVAAPAAPAAGAPAAPAAGAPAAPTAPATAAPTEAPATEADAKAQVPKEDAYLDIVRDHKSTPEDVSVALDSLREMVKNPTPVPGSTMSEAFARRDKLKGLLATAEREAEMQPVRKRYAEAWQQEKDDIAKNIEGFAKENGITPDEVVQSLIHKDRIKTPTDLANPDEFGESTGTPVWALLDEYIRRKSGSNAREVLSGVAPRLVPFVQSKYAKELGVDGMLGSTLGRTLGVSGVPSLGNVLDEYVKEKAGVLPVSAARSPTKETLSPEAAAKFKMLQDKIQGK